MTQLIQKFLDELEAKEKVKVIDSKKGDDNLKVELWSDNRVLVYKDGKVIKKSSFKNGKEARDKFDEVYKEF